MTNKFSIEGPIDLPKEVWDGGFESKVSFRLSSRSYANTVKTLMELRADLDISVSI